MMALQLWLCVRSGMMSQLYAAKKQFMHERSRSVNCITTWKPNHKFQFLSNASGCLDKKAKSGYHKLLYKIELNLNTIILKRFKIHGEFIINLHYWESEAAVIL
jgi:hypothetical protein